MKFASFVVVVVCAITSTRSPSSMAEHRRSMVKAIVLLATGGEEIEIVTPVDVLRRAQFEVVLAGVDVRRIRRESRRGLT